MSATQKVRVRLADARTLAAGDVGARLCVLSSYSAYLRSLQRAVDLEAGRGLRAICFKLAAT